MRYVEMGATDLDVRIRKSFLRLTHRTAFIALIVCLASLEAPFSWAVTEKESDVRESGRLLAVLLDSGRVVIGLNQELINDPDKGNKGFTPEVFAQQTVALFKARTGQDLANLPAAAVPDMAKPLLARLLEESKKTVASYQTVINLKGVKYKGLIPATFGTETGSRFQAWSGVYLKQTAPEHLLRNPKNKPDALEIAAMRKMGDPSFPRPSTAQHSFSSAANRRSCSTARSAVSTEGPLTCCAERMKEVWELLPTSRYRELHADNTS